MIRQHISAHIEAVLRPPAAIDKTILNSWQRCINTHQLDPTTLQKAVVLSHTELKDHQDATEALMHTARKGMEQLYQQIHQIGYVVLLTNQAGITVDFIGDRTFDNQLRQSGLYLGSDWQEAHAGTCAVGTCIETKHPLTVHQSDHFDASHISLTCSAAPIYAPNGQLAGVLDISALHSPQSKESQYMALQLVKIFSERIENAYFLNHFQQQVVLGFSLSPDFMNLSPDYLLATDEVGKIIGFNRRVKQDITPEHNPLGLPLEHFFNATLTQLLKTQDLPHYQRLVRTHYSQQPLFVQVRIPEPTTVKVAVAYTPSEPANHPFVQLHGGDKQCELLASRLMRLMNSRVNIVLGGETGTGKEYLARLIHQGSARADKPFVAINCAALPESLIESELFGYDHGAFTGSKRGGRMGLIEKANGGTLFLDEIGDMPLLLQSRLLRVLAEKELYPLGGSRKVSLDLHVISASHQNLRQLITEGLFRADLYYRLNGAEFVLPALRERQDFSWLLQSLLKSLQRDTTTPLLFEQQTLDYLQCYAWPGNVRELKNVLMYLVAMKFEKPIQLADLPDSLLAKPSTAIVTSVTVSTAVSTAAKEPMINPSYSMNDMDEQQKLRHILEQQHWNITKVARLLNLSRMTVYRHMKRWNIIAPNKQSV